MVSDLSHNGFNLYNFHCGLINIHKILLFVEQFVIPRETQGTTSSTYADIVASRTVDGDFDQNIWHCSHTNDLATIKEAWLRITLERVYSIKSVKFWYSKYDLCINMCA